MSRLIVHFHIYYHDQVDYFINKMKNINGCDWDLLVTYSTASSKTEAMIKEFKPDAQFLKVENAGYDVWPFIKVLKVLDFTKYDYILKLHTKNISPRKNRINGLSLKYDRWRNILVDSILASDQQFAKCLSLLDNDSKCGIVCSYELAKRRSKGLPEDLSALENEADRIGVTNLKGKFVSGTMFMARLDAFRMIKDADLDVEAFAVHKAESHSRGSLAHVYERLLVFAVYSSGYKAALVNTYMNTSVKVFLHRLLSPVVRYFFSIERIGEGEKEHKRLTFLAIPIKMSKNKSRFSTKLSMVLKGHIFNPPWGSRLERRRRRGEAISKAVERYLDKYIPAFSEVPEDVNVPEQDKERIFTIWFQGEEAAPELVKACWRSIRTHCTQELVVLDAKTVFDWIELPEYVVEKWKAGKIRPAHFADICRIELLYRYGGLWMDATDFVFAPMPQWLMDLDFFVFMSGNTQRGSYSYIQNCFIRGRKGNYLLKAWREAVLAYWKNEDSTIDYFVHQLIFKKVVQNNKKAAECFAKMPSVNQDPTHTIWFGHASDPYDEVLFNELASAAVFQKTEFKSETAKNPEPGTFAEKLINLNK